MLLRELFERVILSEALTAGSNTVLANKKLVQSLADEIRNDAYHSGKMEVFGRIDGKPGARVLQKMDDDAVVTWFLEKLDAITAQGYNGMQYSQNGDINMWVANCYAKGQHTMEDIIGKLGMTMADFKILMNQNPPILPENLRSLTFYKGIKDLARYVTIHYGEELSNLRENAKKAAIYKAINKTAITFPLLENDDYVITTALNQTGAMKVGMNTKWCTASTSPGATLYFNYADKAMLFQIFPKDATQVEIKKLDALVTGLERYQFDASGPYFHDIADGGKQPEFVKQRFPYLYDDLTKALKQNAEKLQEIVDSKLEDPKYSQARVSQVRPYNINDEIRKLDRFIERGYMSKTPRPVKLASPEPEQGEDEAPPAV